LVNGAQYKGTPFQTDAARRLQDLDSTLQTVAMVDAPPEPEPAAAPSLDDSFQLSSPADYGLQLRTEVTPANVDQQAPPPEEPADLEKSDEPPPDPAEQGGY